ncbi:Lrp/AsnC family leucine-responsive transcriptional regulator [Paenibacillus sp. BK033]|uniref:Lrp/AsnC family transcriptional regulator n=1 Tax=Paenibacillus sp. BK033 TaxID=2512133 RepID=UPI00105364BE|nr:Lrp/AsnC family transcriptional regulator [Paenibacillus sp. BK033]TCN01234.1 Lrp/AsnC family leucine-responsive transcriptional regulator [Paenibacillus sp. BK033]
MLSSYGIDDIDRQILSCLIADASQSHKSIGEQVHMTGQAVGARVRKLQDLGIIEGTTVNWNPEKIGLTVHAFVTVFLSSNTAHQTFQQFAGSSGQVVEIHRVSGEGCYWMRVRVGSQPELTGFLDELLAYGNYKVSLSIGQMK